MSEHDPVRGAVVAPDRIEGGRLARAGGDRGPSLAERLSKRFRKLTWRIPLHAARLDGRYPLKLLAAPDGPGHRRYRAWTRIAGRAIVFFLATSET